MPPTETDWHPYGPADPTDRSLDDEKGEEQEEGEHDEETEQDEEEGEEKEEQREALGSGATPPAPGPLGLLGSRVQSASTKVRITACDGFYHLMTFIDPSQL